MCKRVCAHERGLASKWGGPRGSKALELPRKRQEAGQQEGGSNVSHGQEQRKGTESTEAQAERGRSEAGVAGEKGGVAYVRTS